MNRCAYADRTHALLQAAPIFIATYIVSMFFPALDSIIKEKSFSDARLVSALTTTVPVFGRYSVASSDLLRSTCFTICAMSISITSSVIFCLRNWKGTLDPFDAYMQLSIISHSNIEKALPYKVVVHYDTATSDIPC